MSPIISPRAPSREQLLHSLYEAAELEHNLMCTYLYAAFSLKDGEGEGLSREEAASVAGWRRVILDVAIEEMGHLTAVWNITSALGGTPRFGRTNFPLDPGFLPAGIVVRLAPFSAATLQHFIFLERPETSSEPDGDGFVPERSFSRVAPAARLTPMAMDYETVGEFYSALGRGLRALVDEVGEAEAFCGDPALQLASGEAGFKGIKPVICLKTALQAFDSIVLEGEGAPEDAATSHFSKFVAVRTELAAIMAHNPGFQPAHPAATNPVLRRPPRPEGRVWIEDATAAAVVDLANAAYGLTLRLLANAYAVPRPRAEKALSVDLATALMRATTYLGECAARLPAGASNPGCNAGVSFTTLRDAAPLPAGPAARRFFTERLDQLSKAAAVLAAGGDRRLNLTARQLAALSGRAARGFEAAALEADAVPAAALATPVPTVAARPAPAAMVDGVEVVEGTALTLRFDAKRCIHARFCVTGAPTVFLANTKGAWIHPDTMEVERLVDIAHACPSGAIQYMRKDGAHDEVAPPVNLATVREAGPYAFRGDLRLDGASIGMRATLCRCGASKNKPYCDSSHHDAGFTATGEPPTGDAEMLAVRDGPLAIDPEPDGPLQVRGNLEITSGTGRVVARPTSARLCRCGASSTKPFCDGSHARVGFKSG